VRTLGYSIDDEEDEIGERCVGAPILDADSAIVAALSVAGTVSQVPNERIPVLANSLKRTAAQISSRLGSIWKGSEVRAPETSSTA
jgi:DNA-binding IclR family transcriptional regulator